jgi:hypothetical protein
MKALSINTDIETRELMSNIIQFLSKKTAFYGQTPFNPFTVKAFQKALP